MKSTVETSMELLFLTKRALTEAILLRLLEIDSRRLERSGTWMNSATIRVVFLENIEESSGID